MRDIYSVGFSEDGAYVDFPNDPAAFVITPLEANLLISTYLEVDEPVKGMITNENLLQFRLHEPLELGKGWRVAVGICSDDSDETIEIGTWTGPYTDILHWVERVNRHIVGVRADSSATSASLSPIEQRIVRNRKLVAMPGYSMGLLSASPPKEYRKDWMGAVAENAAAIVARRAKLATLPEVKWTDWPLEETWNTVFKRLKLNESSPRLRKRAVELCFEFLYLDDDRHGRYGIVEIGKLPYFTMLWHENNERFGDGRVFGAGINPDHCFETAIDQLIALGTSRRGREKPTILATCVATVAHNIVEDLVAEGRWLGSHHTRVLSTNELVDRLDTRSEYLVVMADNIIANDLMQRWSRDHRPGRLESRLLPYPSPVALGLPYDRDCPEWGGVIREAFRAMLKSKDRDVHHTWRETVAGLEQIGMVLEPSLTHEARETLSV
jgi:hypothetical protein